MVSRLGGLASALLHTSHQQPAGRAAATRAALVSIVRTDSAREADLRSNLGTRGHGLAPPGGQHRSFLPRGPPGTDHEPEALTYEMLETPRLLTALGSLHLRIQGPGRPGWTGWWPILLGVAECDRLWASLGLTPRPPPPVLGLP